MDARDIIADAACRPDWNKYETANYILQRLADAGFSVIHRDENHGPTLERAARLAKACVTVIDAARNIRAMGEKK